ncbi:MAG: TIGR03905 family TSCPD domain-containing protein [Planctomycetota bacterium]|nr:TIGR03905 family TSCPD domain-containing protein [Planctomycetota bacterium]
MVEKTVIIPENVCSTSILVETEDGVIRGVAFENGCDGNGKALGRLLRGMEVEEAIRRLRGVACEDKGTSCADQLALGLQNLLPDGKEGG